LEGPWQGPGHLNVRERGFGHITAQKGLRIGLQEGLQEALWDPILGPVLRPNPLLCPHVLRIYCSDIGSQEGPQEGPGRPCFEPVLRPNPLLCPHVYRSYCSGGASNRGSQGCPWAGPALGQPLGWPWGGTSLGRVYTWDGPWAIPYNARARNVRACPRARARGMNLPRNTESLF